MKKLAAINWVLAILCEAGLVMMVVLARREAAEAVRLYGHNTDSGAYLVLFGGPYFLAGTVLATFAGVAFWCRWKAAAWIIEAAAVVWLAWPWI